MSELLASIPFQEWLDLKSERDRWKADYQRLVQRELRGVVDGAAEIERLRELDAGHWIARRELADNREQWLNEAKRLRAALERIFEMTRGSASRAMIQREAAEALGKEGTR